jgi:hypothetical protein
MKVWLGYDCYHCYTAKTIFTILKTIVKVFDDESKALAWQEEFVATETEWRTYEEMEVE